MGFGEVKAVFWADNRLGDGPHDALPALVSAGVLERREEPDEQFRWNERREETVALIGARPRRLPCQRLSCHASFCFCQASSCQGPP